MVVCVESYVSCVGTSFNINKNICKMVVCVESYATCTYQNYFFKYFQVTLIRTRFERRNVKRAVGTPVTLKKSKTRGFLKTGKN